MIDGILLNDGAKINFIKGLIRVAKADGVVEDEEYVFYMDMAEAFKLDEKAVEELDEYRKSDKKDPVIFETTKEKIYFIVQAIKQAWSDNNYTQDEKDELTAIAQEMGISCDVLEKIEKISAGREISDSECMKLLN